MLSELSLPSTILKIATRDTLQKRLRPTDDSYTGTKSCITSRLKLNSDANINNKVSAIFNIS